MKSVTCIKTIREFWLFYQFVDDNLATGLMNVAETLSYPVEHLFRTDFRVFSTLSYVEVRKLRFIIFQRIYA